MRIEKVTAEISDLMDRMDNEPDDAREHYREIRRKLAEVRESGEPVPESLIRLERDVERGFCALSQGR